MKGQYPARHVQGELAKPTDGRALLEAQGQTELQKTDRPRIEPIGSESRCIGHVADGGS
jgi:hypothetical protein